MRKSVIAASLAAVCALPSISSAQQAAAEAKSPHTITGNLTVITDYRFRGISQTFGKPAIQGGIDYSHANGLYLGNWNSNVSETAGFPNANLEMDFYGGWKNTWGDLGLDLGAIYYYYPGSKAAGRGTPALGTVTNLDRLAAGAANAAATGGSVDNKELYIGGSWKWISVKLNYAIDDYFSTPGTRGTYYTDLSANYDLGGGWGVNGHIGHLKVKNYGSASYTDYKIGVTKDLSGWVFGAALVDTNAKDSCAVGAGVQPYCLAQFGGTETYRAGKSTVLLSVGKTF